MIRTATLYDYETLVALFVQENQHNHAVAPTRVARTTDVLTRTELEDFLADPAVHLSVFKVEEKLVGLILASHHFQPAHRWKPELNYVRIEEIVVTVSHRGQGIATQLVKNVFAWAKTKGANTVDLHVWKGNEQAIRFYEKMGFGKKQFLMSTTLKS